MVKEKSKTLTLAYLQRVSRSNEKQWGHPLKGMSSKKTPLPGKK
jgi:hypothetical protein